MGELPPGVVDEAVRLSRRARNADDAEEAAAHRAERADLLGEHGYEARVRTEDSRTVLVCYPSDWRVDGVVDPDRINDLDRAVERPLTGPGDPDDWEAIEAHNRAIAAGVTDRHGPVHGATADAFADFMGNHLARRVETAGPAECGEFLDDYLPRNAWPSDEQLARAEESLQLVFETADAERPPISTEEQ
ncbi:MAG: rnhA operon protein [Halobacteriales archaeon]